MIGVASRSVDLETAAELFELLKTAWEPAVPGREYDALVGAGGDVDGLRGKLLLLFGSHPQTVDGDAGVSVEQVRGPVDARWGDTPWPLYSDVALFEGPGPGGALSLRGRPLEYGLRKGGQAIRRIGYDLLREVRYLLTEGQPASRALIPTLELHLALLRQELDEAGIAFVEVLPRPSGFAFICCLTHDVDFFGIRRHGFDRTMGGFVLRASVGTLLDLVRGRRTVADALRNWRALCSLPLVFLGWVRDPWRPFDDYARIEDSRRSTFFLVPFRNRPGLAPDGTVDRRRAVPYGIREIAEEAANCAARGCELGVHGIDAWRDADAGRAELEELRSVTGTKTAGVRMHWLYFSSDSPQRLEAAGFEYDSTWGYNEAVGYRAGTSQAFRPLGSATVMELPMSVMDSALFSARRMNLSFAEAWSRCRQIVANAKRFGGTLVINWHERSLAPERLWGRFYCELVREIENRSRVWFASAAEAVQWYRWRRSIGFRSGPSAELGVVRVTAPCPSNPGAVIRVHRPGRAGTEIEDTVFDGRRPVDIQL